MVSPCLFFGSDMETLCGAAEVASNREHIRMGLFTSTAFIFQVVIRSLASDK